MAVTRPQVRLDADVAEALGRDVERKGGSLSDATNRWLRRALGLRTGGGDRTPAADQVASPARASITPPKGAGCTHPVNRRVGGVCMVCHKPVAAGR